MTGEGGGITGTPPGELSADMTASQIRLGVLSGSFAVRDVAELYLSRIHRLNPIHRAWSSVDDAGVLREARRLDRRRPDGARMPLFGVPVGIKDTFYVRGMPMTSGSPVLADYVAPFDGAVVRRLRSAGALIMGKTVTTEWAASDRPPTRNAHDVRRTPGGSSCGSAVAVAERSCLLAVGTQTAGSVLRPAAYNGVVGFKPTLGRISRWGIVPDSWSIACPGFLTESVEDAARMLSVVAGYDSRDRSTVRRPVPDYTSGLTPPPPPSRWRVGVAEQLLDNPATSPKTRELLYDTIASLERVGVRIERFSLPADWDAALAAHWIVMLCETSANQANTFDWQPEMYGPHIRSLIEVGRTIPATVYLAALKVRQQFRRAVAARLEHVDAVIAPTVGGVAPVDEAADGSSMPQTGDHSLQMPWTFIGLPSISLPLGSAEYGMPTAVQMVGRWFEEETLFQIAACVEELLDGRTDIHTKSTRRRPALTHP